MAMIMKMRMALMVTHGVDSDNKQENGADGSHNAVDDDDEMKRMMPATL